MPEDKRSIVEAARQWVLNWINSDEYKRRYKKNLQAQFIKGSKINFNSLADSDIKQQNDNLNTVEYIYTDIEDPKTRGEYNFLTHSITLKPNMRRSTPVHEMTHALQKTQEILLPQESQIQKIIKGHYSRPIDMTEEDYKKVLEDCFYPRINQLRYESGLKPGQKVNKKWLDSNRIKIRNNELDIIDDDALIQILNTVASNNTINSFENKGETYLVKSGGRLNYLDFFK